MSKAETNLTRTEEQYHERVDDLVELLNELISIDQQIKENEGSEVDPEMWAELVNAVEEHIGEIGLPLDPMNFDKHSTPYLNAPSYQGDHIGVYIEWKSDGLHVTAHVLPHIAGLDVLFYGGAVGELSESTIEQASNSVKQISPDEALPN